MLPSIISMIAESLRVYVVRRNGNFVVLNKIAQRVIEEVRGVHPIYVFTYRGKPLKRMNDKTWRQARRKVGLPHVRGHDLKHTFGRRLLAAGVSSEGRQDLLGHKSGRITTHYSAPELINLIAFANGVCSDERHKIDTMVILKKKRHLHAVA